MKKVSVSATNDLCPQTLFVYGTMNEDGTPNFGLFCWFSYCWFEQLGVICAIGGSKRTLENIRRTGVFSANLVVENNLSLADYFGTADRNDSDCGICEYCHVLDAGNSVSLPKNLPECGCGPAYGG